MGVTFQETITLTTLICCTCGVTYAMPEDLNQKLLETGKCFHCPNGHLQHYGSEIEKLRKQLVAEKAETMRQRENYFAEQRRHEQTTKQLRQVKRRTAAGVCPCCKRTFSQLARHMQTKHTDFVKEHGVPVIEKPKE